MDQQRGKCHESGITRRAFLKRAAGLTVFTVGAGPAFLATSCARGPAATPAPPTQAPTEVPEPTAAEVGGKIDYLSWEGYDLRGCMEPWEEDHNVSIASTYIGSHEEIQAKLAAAPGGLYDLITYYHGWAQLYKDLDIVSPLDPEKLPNFEHLYEMFRTGHWWVEDDGTIWGVPFTFGSLGCCYNADEIDPPESWRDLLQPEFKNKIAIVDTFYMDIVIGAQIVGLRDKLPLLTEEELAQVIALYKEFKENARTIAVYGQLADLFAAGEIVATIPGWAAVNVWSQERGVNVQTVIPKEGAATFIDAYAIPPDCDNRETVLAWINESIGPEMQACQAEGLAGGVVNPDGVPLVQDPAIKAMYDYDNLDQLFERAPVFDTPPLESEEYTTYDDWLTAWEELKAA